jgi:hypothetical protein
MASTRFDGKVLFESGPHRFALGWMGRAFDFGSINTLGQIEEYGVLELTIRQTGRLTGATESELFQRISAIRVEAESKTTGQLLDAGGRVWNDMTMLRFRLGDRVDRGRVLSVSYDIFYAQLSS